jgi:hypothetical protein
MRLTSWPSANTSRLGKLITSNRRLSSGWASTSTLATRSAPACSTAISSRIRASAWHGGHHSAQKSTTTGTGDPPTTSSNVAAVSSTALAATSASSMVRP